MFASSWDSAGRQQILGNSLSAVAAPCDQLRVLFLLTYAGFFPLCVCVSVSLCKLRLCVCVCVCRCKLFSVIFHTYTQIDNVALSYFFRSLFASLVICFI